MSDLISRQAAIDAIEKHLRQGDEIYRLTDTARIMNHAFETAASCVYNLPSAQPEWNNHTVACLLADVFGDDCSCNYNGIDEWLPSYCDVLDSCPTPCGVACWEQYLKYRHKAERKTNE